MATVSHTVTESNATSTIFLYANVGDTINILCTKVNSLNYHGLFNDTSYASFAYNACSDTVPGCTYKLNGNSSSGGKAWDLNGTVTEKGVYILYTKNPNIDDSEQFMGMIYLVVGDVKLFQITSSNYKTNTTFTVKVGDYVAIVPSMGHDGSYFKEYGLTSLEKDNVPGASYSIFDNSNEVYRHIYRLSGTVTTVGAYSMGMAWAYGHSGYSASSTSGSINGTLTLIVEPATPTIKVNVGGTWKDSTPKVKVSGEWKDVTKVFMKVDGTWKEHR